MSRALLPTWVDTWVFQKDLRILIWYPSPLAAAIWRLRWNRRKKISKRTDSLHFIIVSFRKKTNTRATKRRPYMATGVWSRSSPVPIPRTPPPPHVSLAIRLRSGCSGIGSFLLLSLGLSIPLPGDGFRSIWFLYLIEKGFRRSSWRPPTTRPTTGPIRWLLRTLRESLLISFVVSSWDPKNRLKEANVEPFCWILVCSLLFSVCCCLIVLSFSSRKSYIKGIAAKPPYPILVPLFVADRLRSFLEIARVIWEGLDGTPSVGFLSFSVTNLW